MTRYALHPEAFADLEEIRQHIARDNAVAADRIIAEIFETFETISSFPDAGHLRPGLTAHPLRFQVVREYLVAYAPAKTPVWIVAVVHGRRSPRLMASILRGRR